MPGLRETAVDAVTYAGIDKSLSDILAAQIKECAKGRSAKEYFYLTELLNPTESYWQRVAPEPHPLEVLRLLKYGQKMHYAARFWFRTLPNFVATEAVVNGHYVGIPGVVGRVDYMMGDSILEFKTKQAESVSRDDVLQRYPQDLEQLVFYAALSPNRPGGNSLVYMTRGKDGSARFSAFRAEVRDFEVIAKELTRRLKELRGWLASRNPAGSPKCRYYACRFDSAGKCECANALAIDPGWLTDAVALGEDKELTRDIFAAYEETRFEPGEEYDVWDLVLPRKWYHGHFDYTVDEELATYSGFDAEKLSVWALLDSAIAASPLGVPSDERRSLRQVDHVGVSGPRRYMKVNLPARGEGTLSVPYTRKRYGGRTVPTEKELPEIYYAELAAECARAGVSNGVIVVHFPRAGGRTVCYSVGFDLEKITRAARGVKEALNRSKAQGTPDGLGKCEDYMLASCHYKGCSCRTG